jgi:hypothetical protein
VCLGLGQIIESFRNWVEEFHYHLYLQHNKPPQNLVTWSHKHLLFLMILWADWRVFSRLAQVKLGSLHIRFTVLLVLCVGIRVSKYIKKGQALMRKHLSSLCLQHICCCIAQSKSCQSLSLVKETTQGWLFTFCLNWLTCLLFHNTLYICFF